MNRLPITTVVARATFAAALAFSPATAQNHAKDVSGVERTFEEILQASHQSLKPVNNVASTYRPII